MCRCALILVLVTVTVTSADDADVVTALKKLMPKDQLAIAEKVEDIADLNRQAADETNGLKRKELQDKSAKLHKELTAELVAKVRKDGLSGWVLRCSTVHETGLYMSAPGLFSLFIAYDGMAAADKETCRGLEVGDVVAFTLKANPKAGNPLNGTNVMFHLGRVNGSALKSLEKK